MELGFLFLLQERKNLGKSVRIEIFGDPVAQGRPRAFRRGNHIGMYDPKKSSDWKNNIRMQALAQKAEMLDGAISMNAEFFLARPKSLPKKVLHHIKRPDVDNLLKAVKDALKGICYRDDSQIVKVLASKQYAIGRPGVFIFLSTELQCHNKYHGGVDNE